MNGCISYCCTYILPLVGGTQRWSSRHRTASIHFYSNKPHHIPPCRWNPAVEQQAQDRIHRLGQYKPIHVTRFVIAGTIEERILKLQVPHVSSPWLLLLLYPL